MLPFSSLDFYVVAGIFVLWVFVSKLFLKKYITFANSLLAGSLIYLVFYYPKPLHILIFIVYTYFTYYLFISVIKSKNKLIGTLLILIPMILVKSAIKVHYYPFYVSEWLSFAGLSYISFRIVSIYVEAVPGTKPVNFLQYVNFLVFTPTLLIGPIDRFTRYTKDLKKGYGQVNLKNFILGWQAILLGIFYKYIGAEVVDRYWLSQFDHTSSNIVDMLNVMYAYYVYLFFDFAGYSAMAIGFGKMIGIDVPVNFNKPFIARNPQDFWRRFHKSLGDWLRDFFFMPFYKFFSTKKRLKPYPLFRQNISLFSTFLLMGCWNGFRKHYIISGSLFGLYSVAHNTYIYYSRKKRRDIVFGKMNDKLVQLISIFIMFNMAAFAIYIFSGLSAL